MSKRYFVGDIHGSLKAMQSVFEKITLDPEDTLYFLGDYVDRGDFSKEVLELAMVKDLEPNIHFLLGNHDKMFIDFVYMGDALQMLNDTKLSCYRSYFPNKKMYYNNLYDVIEHGTHRYLTKDIRTELLNEKTIQWLLNRPIYLETESQIIVHAGIDKTLADWKQTPKEDMYWIRPILTIPNRTGKDIIMGHTPTSHFMSTGDEQPSVYFAKKTKEIYIDTLNYVYDNAIILVYDCDTEEYSVIN